MSGDPKLNGEAGDSQNGRSAKTGRFVKGNKGGPGNPMAPRLQKMRIQMYEAITPAEFKNVVRRMYLNAMQGDVAAAKLLFQYLVGLPKQTVEIYGAMTLTAALEQFRGVETDELPLLDPPDADG